MYPEGRKAAVTPKANPPARRAGRAFWGLELVLEQGLAVVTQMGSAQCLQGQKPRHVSVARKEQVTGPRFRHLAVKA